jgi:chromosome segregation ATPase
MSDQNNDNRTDLDEIPVIAAEKDELDSRRRTLAAPRQSNFRGLLVFSLVLMAVMLGIGGYTLYEVQQRLDRSNELLEQANKGVRDLEARLAATGTDVSKELQTLKEQQATNFSEIDKLWRVSYRENKPAIAKLEQSLKGMVTANNQLGKDIVSLTTESTRTAEAVAVLTRSVATESDELKTTVGLVRGQVENQADQSEAQKRSIATINQQLKAVDEAIDAIDRYRQQVNQQLIELRNAPMSVPAG